MSSLEKSKKDVSSPQEEEHLVNLSSGTAGLKSPNLGLLTSWDDNYYFHSEMGYWESGQVRNKLEDKKIVAE